MNRLANNRLFISFLLVVIQFAFRPNAGRCSSASPLGGSCCCESQNHDDRVDRAGSEGPATGHSCCSKPVSKSVDGSEGVDPLERVDSAGDKGCHCSASGELVAAWAEKSERDKEELSKRTLVSLPAGAQHYQSYGAISARTRSRPIPRACTGPPLQILFQVFLI